jgi:hypothetical protein
MCHDERQSLSHPIGAEDSMDDMPDDLIILHNEHGAMHEQIVALKAKADAQKAAFHDLMARRDSIDGEAFHEELSRIIDDTETTIAALEGLMLYSQLRIDTMKGGTSPAIALFLQGE